MGTASCIAKSQVLHAGYVLRLAAVADADTIAFQRAAMFAEMGTSYSEEHTTQFAPWIRDRLSGGTYLGLLIEHAGQVVAGAGLMFLDWPPSHLDPGSRRAYLLNVYTEPKHRGCGLARALTQAAIHETRARGIAVLALHASEAGRPLYTKLGFQATNEMRFLTSVQGS
ncbi:GNAT family N-acetyltransferase [Deinococcus peraridilitoris]|uniref:Sortase-like acyltransferase n=1 Tax=Deinococcus peraridilitoris (strain DSM 19664 / LMG 22246 / CIP 109416 / KR-200) TaxID=937777 RepID=L0A4L9_DEIPD|nr:GNAT family N-acetyltransferase [Deinococcus peraridilitoris]AFZ68384.1 sortase-like acyltransferase [Deinococcus peraridilitoris DSM 19664]